MLMNEGLGTVLPSQKMCLYKGLLKECQSYANNNVNYNNFAGSLWRVFVYF